MQKLFYRELLRFLEMRACIKIQQRGVPSEELMSLDKLFKKFEKKQDLRTLEKIIEKYYDLEGKDTSNSLEIDLMNSLSSKELRGVKTIPKILRGLPRYYHHKNAALSKIHPFFSNLFHVKKKVLDKTLFYLYENIKIKEVVEVACLYEKEEEKFFFKSLFKGVKKKLKNFEFSLVPFKYKKEKEALVFTKDKKISLRSSAKNLLSYVRSVPLIFQLFQPASYVDAFFEKVKKEDCPHYEVLGGYGQFEEEPFFPKSPFSSLGLHFLELGVLTFEKKTRTPPSVPFYLCAHFGKEEALFYTKLLLDLRKKDNLDMKIVFFSKDVLEAVYAEMLLIEDLKIQSVNISTDQTTYERTEIGSYGKNLFLTLQVEFTYNDKTDLFANCLEPIGVSSDMGFSYAISYDKTYVFSKFDQKCCLLKDLIALAKNRVPRFPKTIVYLETLHQLQMHFFKSEDLEYVTEEYFQLAKLDTFEDIQKRLSLLVNSKEVILGLKELNAVIYDKFSANGYLTGLIKRAYLHHKHEDLKQLEYDALAKYLVGASTFFEMIKSITISIKKFI